jgi:DNA-binding NarL/FixJ family response regulator
MNKVQINIGIIAPSSLTQITIKKAIQYTKSYDVLNIVMEESSCCAFLNKISPLGSMNRIHDREFSLDILLIHEEDENRLYEYTENIFSAINDPAKIPKIFFITSLQTNIQKVINLIGKGVSSFYAIENLDLKTLVDALEITQNKGGWIDPHFTIKITEQLRDIYDKLNRIQISRNSLQITQQQKSIIELIASGYDNEEIAQKLKLSRATVKTNIFKMLQKSSCRNRTALAIWAISNNIVYLDKSR